MPLLWVLRDLLGMNGTKFGCGVALCGACTVHLDGIRRRSCVMPVSAAAGHAITTIEAIGATPIGKRVQQAWLDLEVSMLCESLIAVSRNSIAILLLLAAGCGPQLRSGYTAGADSCTCVGVDGGMLTVRIWYAVTDCGVQNT